MYLFQEASVYCGTYAKYNSGSHYGKWMNLDDYDTYEEFCEAIKELHKDEDDPEYMFQDCEDMQVEGEPTLTDIREWYELFKYNDYGDVDEDVVMALVKAGWDLKKAVRYDDYLIYHTSNYEELGMLCAEDQGIPEWIVPYFDYDSYGKDCANNYSEYEVNGDLYFFDEY